MLPKLDVGASWAVLAVAIVLEVGGTTSMRLSEGLSRLGPTLSMFAFYAVAFVLNAMVIRTLGLSVVYAVWSGAGTVLTAIVGYAYFHEPMTALKIGSAALIVIGVVGMHAASRAA